MAHPFARILLATEHTEFDAGAERLAFELAKRCGISLAAILPVLSNPEYEAVAPQLAARAEQEAAGKMEDLRARAKSARVPLDVVARRGEEPYLEIVQEAAERNSDLVIIRRRGKRSFLSNLLIGEMVSKVVGHAPCSVLFVPRSGQMWSRGILAAIDTSPAAGHVAHVAAKIAKECNIPLTIISVLAHDTPATRSAAADTLSHAAAVASAAGARAETRILTGRPFEQILATVPQTNADLIVVGRHGESNVIRTPFGGTTQKVIGLSDWPVLVCGHEYPAGAG